MTKVLLVGNTSWSMFNFRENLLKSLIDSGYKVIVIAPRDNFSNKLESEIGVEYHDIEMNRRGLHPLKEIVLLYKMFNSYKKINPDLIFHYTIKPNIYGSLISGLLRIPSVAITTGLGYAFIENNLITKFIKLLYKIAFKFSREVWFLNKDDLNHFINNRIVSIKKTFLLNGEGIDITKFRPMKTGSNGKPISFILIARMLWDKGVAEFVEAAKIVKNKSKLNIKFKLLGPADDDNPSAISKKQLLKWQEEGLIEYLGITENVLTYINDSSCVVLPSYREGIPRTLLEASCMGKPIITTDAVGCKDVVEDGVTGFICKIKDPDDLADKISLIMNLSDSERIIMGNKGHEKIVKEYNEKEVIDKYFHAINRLI